MDERKADYLRGGQDLNKAKSIIEKEVLIAKRFKENTYVSCWSLNNAESYALWKIYLGGSINGVAIKSTVSKLIHCLEKIDSGSKVNSKINSRIIENSSPLVEIDRLQIGEVSYKNHIELAGFEKSRLAITKKEYYEYEKEIRIFGTSNNQYLFDAHDEYNLAIQNGFHVSIDIDELIDNIIISPYSPAWFKENLRVLIGKLNKRLLDKLVDSEILLNS